MQIHVRRFDLPLARPFRIARGTRTVAANVLVEVHAGDVVGRGEGAPNARYGQDQDSAFEALHSFDSPTEDPFEVARVLEVFDDEHAGQWAARCALQSALWDWAGQRLGRSLGSMLGLDAPTLPPSSWTISIDDPDGIAARVDEARGWPVLKVKLGGGDADERAIETLRRHTDKPIRVDANEAWTVDEAREKLPWLAARGCELVEQPLPAAQLEDMAELKISSPLPLVADESCGHDVDLDALARGFHAVNVKLMKCGGIREAVALLHGARQRGMRLMLGCFIESSVGISAAAPLAGLVEWVDLDGAALLAEDPFEGARVEDGRVSLPEAPGLGLRPRGGGNVGS